MKEIVIASGKGGAGKTSLSAVFCALVGSKGVYVDADVDAANLEILLGAKKIKETEFFSGKKAKISSEECTNCGLCVNVCRFDAIFPLDDVFSVNEISCEGCGACLDVCDFGAITLDINHSGDWFVSETKFGGKLIHANLGIGEENSGKLVTEIKKKAKEISTNENLEYVIIDAPPGIGCPIISSLSGADLMVIVAEAGISGIQDASRLLELANSFKLKVVCVLNKTGLNPNAEVEFEDFLNRKGVPTIGKIPFREEFIDLLNKELTWLEMDDMEVKEKLHSVWKCIENTIRE